MYKDIEKKREAWRRYYKKNKEKLNEYKMEYFYKNKEHMLKKARENYAKNIDKKREYGRNYRKKNYHKYREQQNESNRNLSRKIRYEVISHYSKGTMQCACCGESIHEFLTIDHINNDGAEHRRKTTGSLYRFLKKNDFPDGFQVLCWNCNCAKGHYGHCPHTKKE